MDFDILYSGTKTAVIFWLGIVLLFLTFFQFSLILVLRFSLLRKARQKKNLIDAWSPVLKSCMEQAIPEVVPVLRKQDLYIFLPLWLNLYETADENARELLILVALQVGLEKKIRFHLNRAEPVRQRILLLSVIGALKDPAFQEICFQYLTAENSFLSLAAARALLQINPQGNIAPVVEMLARRHDWPTSRTSLALLEAGIDVISQPLAELLWKTPTQDLPYLIPYLDITSSETAIPTLQTILANTSDEQVILACLRGLARSSRYQYTDIIGLFLSHTNPHIRAEAVHTMSHIGAFTDGLLILPLLEDNIPLVQYRAAQALINLPGMTQTKARQLQQLLKNPSAVTTLTRVIDEKRFKR